MIRKQSIYVTLWKNVTQKQNPFKMQNCISFKEGNTKLKNRKNFSMSDTFLMYIVKRYKEDLPKVKIQV